MNTIFKRGILAAFAIVVISIGIAAGQSQSAPNSYVLVITNAKQTPSIAPTCATCGVAAIMQVGPSPTIQPNYLAPQFLIATTITDTGILSGECVQTSTGGLFVGASCSGSGTLTGITPGSNLATSTPNPAQPTISIASPSPTACPSAMAGWSSTFGLQYENGCAVTTVSGSGNITVSVGPSPVVSETNSPTWTGTATAQFYSGVSLVLVAPSSTPAPTSQVAIYNDDAATKGMEFNVPSSSTNGYQFMVNGTAQASISSIGLMTSNGGFVLGTPASTPAPTTQVAIYNDLAATKGMEFNVPSSSTNGYRFLVNGTAAATIGAGGLITGNQVTSSAGYNAYDFNWTCDTNHTCSVGSSTTTVAGIAATIAQITDQTGSVNAVAVNEAGAMGIASTITSGAGYGNCSFYWGASGGNSCMGAASGVSVAGVTASLGLFQNSGGGNAVAFDTSGNAGFAANTFQASSRALKRDIGAMPFDPLELLYTTTWVQWCYKSEKQCNVKTPGDASFGYIAEDTSPYLSGPKHNRTSPQNLAAIDAAAIKELAAQIQFGSKRRMDSLQKQIYALDGAVVVLLALVGFLFVKQRHA
jgi:hypothetical protein